MKVYFFILFSILVFSPTIFIYSQTKIRPGEQKTYRLEFDFNKEAIKENSYLEFELRTDLRYINVEIKPEIIPYDVDSTKGFKFKILPNKGDRDANSKDYYLIILSVRDSAKSKDYNFLISRIGSNKIEESNIYIKPGYAQNIDLKLVNLGKPTPLWIKIMIIILLIIIIVLIVLYILTRPNMALGKKTFKRGIITFPDGNSKLTSVRLNDLMLFNFNKAFENINIELIPIDRKDKKGKVKRYARLKNTSTMFNVKVIHSDGEDIVGANYDLLHSDEIEITFNEKKYIFRYTNNQNLRSHGK